jgi:hypothetical protein
VIATQNTIAAAHVRADESTLVFDAANVKERLLLKPNHLNYKKNDHLDTPIHSTRNTLAFFLEVLSAYGPNEGNNVKSLSYAMG